MIGIYHLHFMNVKTSLEKSNNLLPNHSAIMLQRRNSKLDFFALWFFSSILTSDSLWAISLAGGEGPQSRERKEKGGGEVEEKT